MRLGQIVWSESLRTQSTLGAPSILHLQEIKLHFKLCLECPRLSRSHRAYAEVTQPLQFRNMHITSLKIFQSIYFCYISSITSVLFPQEHYWKGYFYSRLLTGSKFWASLEWLDTQLTIQCSNCEGQAAQALLQIAWNKGCPQLVVFAGVSGEEDFLKQ